MQELEVVSTVLRGFTRLGLNLGVVYNNGGTYEHDGVPETIWLELKAVAARAAAWEQLGRRLPKKPERVSVYTFYNKQVKANYPLWRINQVDGMCEPANALARRWETQRGSQRTAVAVPRRPAVLRCR